VHHGLTPAVTRRRCLFLLYGRTDVLSRYNTKPPPGVQVNAPSAFRYSDARTVGSTIVNNGGDSWFFITVDCVFGHSIERDTGDVVRAAGGKVLGTARHPPTRLTRSYCRFRLPKQRSLCLQMVAATQSAIKQAGEFGIVAGGQNLAAKVTFIPDVHSLCLNLAQRLIITEAYYWDLNDKSRAFGKRFFERMKRQSSRNQRH
jgi:branched-chain amino acid transport system substrate-binding protein